MRRAAIAVAWLCAAPSLALAQGYTLARPNVGDALRMMDRLDARAAERGIAAAAPLAQTYVLPERPGQNLVSWYDFEWHHYDVPSPSGGQGGIRLYFYVRERDVAERALPVVRNAYLRLVDQFHYTPTKQIPYILYASQREFQTTNVFQVTESVLGVTSPADLKMSLPYFGNHELFREVSTHELVHQFTIQKLLDLAGAEDQRSPIEALPLWFVEGIAEYYAKGGLDPEADLYLRDLVWNPDPERRYQLISFAEDRLRGYIPTYKLGQARVAFIADVYGKERIQSFLENAALLGSGANAAGERGFAALTRRVLNEPIEQVDVRWRAWVKQRYFPEYARTRQDLAQLREVRDLPHEPEAFEVSADGALVFFRGIDREQGRARLYLTDVRDPRGAVEVAADQQPGVESLHPIEHSVMAIGRGLLAVAALDGAGDALYLVPFGHRPPAGGRAPEIALGERRRVPLRHAEGQRFIEIADPAFSPDGTQIAFAGITDGGQQDLYVVPVQGGTARQLTRDGFSERHLAWAEDGLYFASDATDHGKFNLFRLVPATGARTRLTTADANDGHPRPQPDGSVLFSSDRGGKPDVYVLRDGTVRRLTDFATGLTAPAPAPQSRGFWAGTFYRGGFRLVEVPRLAWLDEPAMAVQTPTAPVLEIPRDSFPDATPAYDAFSLGNWHPEAGIVAGGGGGGAIGGRAAVLFSDTLRDNVLYLDLAVYGSFEFTQALALLENRSHRTAWVLGGYHFVVTQVDLVDPNLAYFQRDFGAVGILRFPLDRFRRVETELSLGGVQRYCLTSFVAVVPTSCGVDTSSAPSPEAEGWSERNGGLNPIVGTTFRFGYDTVRYDPTVGPISGDALLLEVGAGAMPTRSALYGFARVDAAKYVRLFGRSKLVFRLGVGSSFAPNEVGRNWARTWWLTSADNLRGYGPLDLAYLIGLHYYVANVELQLPLDFLMRLAIFDSVIAVGGFDFGGVFTSFTRRDGCTPQTLCDSGNGIPRPPVAADLDGWDVRTLTGVLGVNVLFGPLLLRIHFGHPFDIGGIRTPAMQSGTSWVTNVTLRYFFF